MPTVNRMKFTRAGIKHAIEWIQGGKVKRPEGVSSKNYTAFKKKWHEFHVHEGHLMLGNKYVVAKEDRNEIMREFHREVFTNERPPYKEFHRQLNEDYVHIPMSEVREYLQISFRGKTPKPPVP